MKEDEILDILDRPQSYKSIWKMMLLTIIFLIVFVFILRLNIVQHYIDSTLDYYLKSAFILIAINLILFIFIKNINYQKISLWKIIIFNSIILSIGIYLGSIISDISKGNFILNDYLFLAFIRDFTLGSIINSAIISTGIYHWLKNKNYWPLVLIILFFAGLIFLNDYYLTQVDSENHDW